MSERGSVDEIQKAIDQFTDGLPEMEKKRYDKVYASLKDLILDSEGKIKTNGADGMHNLKIISKVKNQLASFVDSSLYQNKVLDLNEAFSRVSAIQTQYYLKTFDDFKKPITIAKIQEIAFHDTVDQLAGSGINQFVVKQSADIVESHIRDGSSFSTLVDELKVKMLGDEKIPSKLISYSKQIINDTMSCFARNYHAIVTNDLDLEWHLYIGALVKSSRPMCVALTAKKYIHKSELAGIARGEVDGLQVSTQGFFPDTTGENFVYRCAGHNCEHQMPPIPSSVVPQELRDRFEVKALQKS